MADVVVLGAGLGGVIAAYEIKEKLRSKDSLTVISKGDAYHFVPSNPWVAVGWRTRKAIEVPLRDVMKRKKIGFESIGAKRVHPDQNRVELEDGRTVPYDYLVIATGPDLAFDEIEGFGPNGFTQSICHVDHAEQAAVAFEQFCKNPGPIVIGAVQGASCFGPAYEFAMILDTELRRRKLRDAKPFAVMVRDMEVARKYCHVSESEEKWLTSPQAPILVLREKEDSGLPQEVIHPGLNTLGVMLPYTPLHYLLFAQDLEILIMTSANISDEPLIIDNAEALKKLSGIADYFLLHDRDIYNPCDDSVMTITPLNKPQLLRRARGFVPLGISLPVDSAPVLAVGGEMKNTFCLSRGREALQRIEHGDPFGKIVLVP